MFKRIVMALFGVFLFAGPAGAACSWTTLTNGSTADANQVMNDLNCLAPLANPRFIGNVGIGTTTPNDVFVVSGLRPVSISPGNNAGFGYGVDIQGDPGGWNVGYTFAGAGGAALGGFGANGNNNSLDHFYIGTYLTDEKMSIFSDGNVGIGTTSPAYTLQVNGTVAGSNAYVNLSDERLKKDIRPIENALQIIEQIHGVSFRWKTPAERSVGKKFDLPVDKPQIGFIAQNLEKVLPQAVSVGKGKDAIMTVAESKVVPVLVEAVKQLKAANDRQTVAVRQLRAVNDEQASEIREMQAQIMALQHKTGANTVND